MAAPATWHVALGQLPARRFTMGTVDEATLTSFVATARPAYGTPPPSEGVAIECLRGEAGSIASGGGPTVVDGRVLLRTASTVELHQPSASGVVAVPSPPQADAVGQQILAIVEPTGRSC